MIWIIVGAVVGLIVWGGLLVEAWDDGWGGRDWFEILFFGGVLGAINGAAATAVVAAALNGIMLPILGGNHTPRSDSYVLQAVAARSNVHGEFFLGSGQIDSDPVYRFYRQTGHGGFVLDSVWADSTTIYEDATTPRIVEHWKVAADPWWCLFWTGGDTTYEIHVPKGSITATTNLDLP